MRSRLLTKISIFSLMLSTIALDAQITYQNSNHVSVGDSIHISKTSAGIQGFNFDTTGANISWDYSSITASSQADEKYISSGDAGYKNTWCLNNGHIVGCNSKFNDYSNIATQSSEGLSIGGFSFENVVNHYKQDSDKFIYKMIGTTITVAGIPVAVPIEYDTPDTVYQFPLTYNGVDSSEFAYSFDLNSIGVNLKTVVSGTRKNEVHGWGSITTPYKTYANVIKLKSTVITKDSVITAQNTTEKIDTVITYSWWDVNEKIPVFEAKATITAGVVVNSNVNYIDDVICVDPNSFFVYAPIVPYYDTTSFSSTVNFTNLSASSDSLVWDFGDGSSTTEKFPAHTYQCPGTYQVKLIATNTVCNPAQSDTITLPVVVVDSAQYFIKSSSVTLCAGDSLLVNGNYEKTAGTYSQTLTSSRGCDSSNTVIISVTDLDTSLLSVGINLSAKELNGEYQWVDCNNNNAPLVGDTSWTYAATQTGNYAVTITKKGCTVTTECKMVIVTGITNADANLSSVYPNPTNGILNVDFGDTFGGQVSVLDFSGRVLSVKYSDSRTTSIDMSQFNSGSYLIKVNAAGEQNFKTFKVLVN